MRYFALSKTNKNIDYEVSRRNANLNLKKCSGLKKKKSVGQDLLKFRPVVPGHVIHEHKPRFSIAIFKNVHDRCVRNKKTARSIRMDAETLQ